MSFDNRRAALTKEWLLTQVSEEEIFTKYLGIQPELKTKFRNPLRADDSPDCNFYVDSRGILKFHDIAISWNVDCFNVVAKLHPDSNFGQVLEIIAEDFGIIETTRVPQTSHEITARRKKQTREVKIEVKRMPWIKEDADFWTSFGIDSQTLAKYKVARVQVLWIDDVIRYRHKVGDPCYVYDLEDEAYKIYWPLRAKGELRFLHNRTSILQGFQQLPETSTLLVLTKALKDVMCLDTYGIPSCALITESVVLTPEQYAELNSRFTFIISLMDFDFAGRRSARQLKEEYDIPYTFFTRGEFGLPNWEAKDFSELCQKNSREALGFVECLKENYVR